MSSSSTDVRLVDVPMPQMGVSVAEGTVTEWRKAIGDPIERDEAICEISTDKIDSECPAPVDGVLAEIVVQAGATVDVGTVLARIAVGDGAAGSPGDAAVEVANGALANGGGAGTARGPAARRYTPVVRRMAEQHDLDLTQIEGTGRGGRVTKRDVLAFLERREERPLHTDSPYRPDPPAPAPAGGSLAPTAVDLVDGGRSEALSRMRQSIGAAMRRSQATAATCTTIVECDMARVDARRRELGVTALPIVARATVETLREFPELNATLDGTTITRYDAVHLGIAVSLGGEGLIVPVIPDAQDYSEQGLAKRIKDLATRARAGQLTPDDVQGATFTITNPGAYGAIIATPVINLPQVAILDLEAIVRRPVVVTDADGNESIGIRPMVNLCMSWDHRALDGAYAAQFLTVLRERLESV